MTARSREGNAPRNRGGRKSAKKASGVRVSLTSRDKLAGQWFAKLVALQARLRGPNGCPWDGEQTHASLRKFLIEETYEVLDAMDSADPHKFVGELGDLLFQVIFHSILAEESGDFTISDVIESVHTKMVRRHPHVFGRATAKNSAEVLRNWEQIKAEERAEERATSSAQEPENAGSPTQDSILAGVSGALPAVLEAYQLTLRASRIGFDWEHLSGLFVKLDEEKREIESAHASNSAAANSPGPHGHLEEEVGDLLFVGVNIARFLGVDPEIALKATNRKFKRRFQWMESAASAEGKCLAELPRARMEALWDESKNCAKS
jgi:tetrapyrrole methylase family protein / MazG family protein